MIVNTRAAVSIAAGYIGQFLTPSNSLILCVGDMPTDAQVDALTAVSNTFITSATAVTLGSISLANMLPKDSTSFPLLMTNKINPTIYKANSTKAGTLGWAVINTGAWFSIVDVGLPNSGAVVQVDVVNVAVNTPVTFLSLSYKFGR